MPRGKRIKKLTAFYHVFARGVEKRSIFQDVEDREKFISFLVFVYKKYKFRIHAYCLMGNHYHLVVETMDEDLSKIFHDLNGLYAQYFNNKYSRVGPLFQGRFNSILVEGNNYLLNLFCYVHLNPVKDGFVSSAIDWEWSSLRAYAMETKVPRFLCTQLYLSKFAAQNIFEIKDFVDKRSLEIWCDLDELENLDFVGNVEVSDFTNQDLAKLVFAKKGFRKFDFDKMLNSYIAQIPIEPSYKRNFSIYALNKIAKMSFMQITDIYKNLNVVAIKKISQRVQARLKTNKEYQEIFNNFMKNCPF